MDCTSFGSEARSLLLGLGGAFDDNADNAVN